ncbi:MAG: cupin domain-containing protein [Sulfobacillus sp.]
MAYITRESGSVLRDRGAIKNFLADHGVLWEYWAPEILPERLRTGLDLNDSEKEELLGQFQNELDRLAHEFGYISHDVIILHADTTPNLDDLLTNFQKEHHHSEDEVRFIVDGEGIFTLTRNGERFAVTVMPGDLISVPRGTRHCFTLTNSRYVKAVRLFQTKEGWVAIYDASQHVS